MGRKRVKRPQDDGAEPTADRGGRIEESGEGSGWDESQVTAIRHRLVAWYQGAQRDLPWRADRDAYRILVSEMMLIQTTVTAVIPYFERFLSRFPDLRSLAEADEADVLRVWEGLGYYRRARQLQAAARQVVRDHAGVIPDDPEAVRALPGVGRYIAGAVMSFAFDRPEPIVEANSRRVLARLIAIREDLAGAPATERIWQVAQRLVPPRGAGSFNQGLMELGALVCTPRQPSCLLCPLSDLCQARRLGLQDAIPVTTRKPPPAAVIESCAVIRRQEKLLVVQRGTGRLWERFWEFPTIHVAGPDPAGRSLGAPVGLAEGVRRLTGIRAEVGPQMTSIRFSVTHFRVTLMAYRGTARSEPLRPGPGLTEARWVEPGALDNYPFSSASRRLIAWLRQHPECLTSRP